MANLIPELHLVLLVVEFIWSALSTYAQTPMGIEQLNEIEAIVGALENNSGTTPAAPNSGNNSGSVAQRKAERGL